MTYEQSLQLELIKTGLTLLVAIVTLALGWFVGQRITTKWNLRQKEREVDLMTTGQFYQLFAEFIATMRLWRAHELGRDLGNDGENAQWSLLKRATDAEAHIEEIFLKLSIERHLKSEQLKILGKYRARFQLLRQAIRDNKKIAWIGSEDPDYIEFKRLACEVADLLFPKPGKPVPANRAVEQLREIMSNQWEDYWKKKTPQESQSVSAAQQ